MIGKYSEIEKRFHRIARQLTRFELQKLGSIEEETVSIDDVMADLEKHSGTSLFMGFYTHSGLMEVFEKYGITKILKDKGFHNLHLRIDTDNPYHHVLQLYWGAQPDPSKLLIEIVLHEAVVTPKIEMLSGLFNMVFIEWMCLQNPLDDFRKDKPRLPDQEKPGLGISMELVELLVLMAERLRKDGLINVPRCYHVAEVAQSIGFLFLDPETEGIMRALKRDLRGHSLAEVTWAVELGLVRRADSSEVFEWPGQEQVLAISEGTKRYFASREYRQRCLLFERSNRFSINVEALRIPG